jgi:ketosteroid isomerase-like protein
MSQENVEAFKRATEAFNRGDIEALLEELDPEVEWHPILLASVVGTVAVYRGHEGVREMRRDTDQAFHIQVEYPEIRDLGDRLVANGHVRAVGKGSGAVTESPICYVVEYRNARAIRVRGYLDPARLSSIECSSSACIQLPGQVSHAHRAGTIRDYPMAADRPSGPFLRRSISSARK